MLRKTLLTLSLGLLGGGIATLFSVPLAWMLGSLFLVLGASLAGLPTGVDKRLHRTAIAMLGLFIGNRIDIAELTGLLAWWPSVLAMLAYVALMLFGGFRIFRRAGVGRMDAMFCAYPGSMNSAVALAERAGGDLRWIAISHSLRLVLVVSSAALLAAHLTDEVAIGEPGAGRGRSTTPCWRWPRCAGGWDAGYACRCPSSSVRWRPGPPWPTSASTIPCRPGC